MKKVRVVALLYFLGIFLPFSCFSADNSALLLGHRWHDQNQIAKKTDAIFVGRFLSVGVGSLSFPGRIDFYNARVKINRVLKGPLTGIATVTYFIETVGEKEESPQANTDYIFFLKIDKPTRLYVVKLLPATGENVASVNSLIQSQAGH